VLLGGEPGGGADQPALLLDVDRVRAVAHDLGDAGVVEQPLQRAVAEDVVGELGGQPGALLGRERDPFLLDHLVQLAEDDGAQRLLGQRRVVHPVAHALEQRLGDAVLEPGERVGGRRHGHRGGGPGCRERGGRVGLGCGVPALGRGESGGEVHDAARCRKAEVTTPPGAWPGSGRA
jgi:hypothetical protein